jgi:glycosyltransferase involved in cell wall biosynthesis
MPFHSVIIPTYNQAKYIAAALESVLNQTDRDWEAIVVNDGSTDSTREIIDSFARRDKRIKCIHQVNGGVARALNTGLQHATGDWIHWLSSDDLFEPRKLDVNRAWIKRNPQSNFFYSYFSLLRESSGTLERRELWGPVPHEDLQIITLFYRNYVSGISICVNRSAWDEVGFFDPNLRYAQDYDQWLRILQKNKGTFIPEWTVISRNHAEQGSETFPAACYFDTAKAAIRFLNEHPFPELVPYADLTREDVALRIVSASFDVACDPSAFIYCMGAQKALIMRILEWVYSDSCRWQAVRQLSDDRVRAMAFERSDTNWAWMWKQLAISLTRPEKRFLYHQTRPTDVAVDEWQSRIGDEKADDTSLSSYLLKFDGVEVRDSRTDVLHQARIAILTKGHVGLAARITIAAKRLLSKGLRPVILTVANATEAASWTVSEGVTIIALSQFDMDTLPWLGDVDLAVYDHGVDRNVWLGSRSAVDLDPDISSDEVIKSICHALDHGTTGAKPVVFLERILSGGGAERVVLDIAQNLDRSRYRPEIWTMFEEHSALPAPRDIPFHRIGLPPAAESSTNEVQIANTRRVVSLSRKIYHRLLNEKQREKLAVGKMLRRIWRTARHHRVVHHTSAAPVISSQSGGLLDFMPAISHHQTQARDLQKSVSKLQNDTVMITVMEEACVAAWMAQSEISFPYIASLHTMESRCIDDIYKDPTRIRSERWLLGNACQRANKVTVPSAGCKDDLVDAFNVSDTLVDVLPNPVNCSRVRQQSFQHLPAVQEWVRRSSGFRLVHVGRLDPQKNHELLFQACAQLVQMKRDFSLALVGDGWHRAALERRIAELGLSGHITLAGEQENPAAWIAAADALTLTSHFESFGLVLVEAMICGTPVVAVDCPVGPRDVLDASKYGVLVEEASAGAFAQAISSLMDSPLLAQQLQKKGYERAVAFDVKQIVPLWERLIDAHGW